MQQGGTLMNKKATSARIVKCFVFSTCLVALSTLAWVAGTTTAIAGMWLVGEDTPNVISVAPASRVENIESPALGLPDQVIDDVTFDTPIITSLVTVANRGGAGHRSFLVTASVSGGGFFSFQVKEDHDDVTLSLTQPIPITGVSIRCDSFSAVVCRYTISLVGNSPAQPHP
jgi:hypothetical protein